MHTLILLAHPEKDSLNAQLARTAHARLERYGNTVELVDLYRESFDPLEGEHHCANRLNEAFFSAVYTSKMRYCDKGRFRGKRAFLSVTTGAPAPAFGPDGRAGDIQLICGPSTSASMHRKIGTTKVG